MSAMTNVTILDGGLSRELTRFGAVLKQPEWSAGALMHHPDAVKRAHQAFFEAGSMIATTASYAVVPFHIGQDVFEAEGVALAALSGKLAQEAAETARANGRDAQVAGSLPPACGSYVPDRFDADEATQILGVLVEGLTPHVDFWLAETMSSLQEIQTTAQACAGTGKPLWIACSLRDDRLDTAPMLRSEEPVEAAVRLAVEVGAEALLFNCSLPEVMERAVIAARETLDEMGTEMRLGVYANGFAPKPREGAANEVLATIRQDLDPPAYLTWAQTWVDAGATLIGGCCGIGSSHIAELHAHFCAPSMGSGKADTSTVTWQVI